MTIKDSLKYQIRKSNLINAGLLILLIMVDISDIGFLTALCFLAFMVSLFHSMSSIKCPKCNHSIYWTTLNNKIFPIKVVHDKCLECGCNYLDEE